MIYIHHWDVHFFSWHYMDALSTFRLVPAEVNIHRVISRCDPREPDHCAESSRWQSQWLCPELTFSIISSCDPDYIALHRPADQDTADPSVQTHWYCAALCTRHTKTALCWCNKRQQRTSNTSVAGTPPTVGQRQFPLCVRVCVWVCVCVFVHVYKWWLYCVHSPHSAGPGVPVWAPQRSWPCPLDNQLVKALISITTLSTSESRSSGPRAALSPGLSGASPARGVGLVHSLVFAGGKSDPPQEGEIISPTHTEFICLQVLTLPLLLLFSPALYCKNSTANKSPFREDYVRITFPNKTILT